MIRGRLIPAIIFGFVFVPSFAAEPDANSIVAKCDEVRNPQLDYTVQVKVTSIKPNRAPANSLYSVMVKGRENAIVKTLEPAIDKGRVLLMNTENFWAFMPNVSKPIRISAQERLTGDVANGDLARTNFSADYDAELIKIKEMKGRKYYTLMLTAKNENVTYGRAVLWVDVKNYRPYQAEFYAFSGRLLKICTYEAYKEFGGGLRPTKLTMRDAVNKDQYSVLIYDKMIVAPLPDKYFTKEYLKKLTN